VTILFPLSVDPNASAPSTCHSGIDCSAQWPGLIQKRDLQPDQSPFKKLELRAISGFVCPAGALADLGSKHMLLKEGIGWGYMPEPMVREDVKEGRLVHLDMPEVTRGSLRFYAIYRTDAPPGPAGSWLIDRFRAQAAAEETAAWRGGGGSIVIPRPLRWPWRVHEVDRVLRENNHGAAVTVHPPQLL
jgi:hypothetical protein